MPILRQPGAPAPYQQIREILRNEILERMAVGDRIPPERELAERFGANRATVSRALASLVSEGLLIRRAARGTFVAGGASPTRNRTRTVAILVPKIENVFPTGVVRSAARELRNGGYKPVLFDNDNSVLNEVGELERLIEDGLEGALMMPVERQEKQPVYDRLIRLGYPLVFLDHKPLDFEADYVGSDHYRGAYEATSRLIARGHKRIAHFTYLGLHRHSAIIDRQRGYEQALIDHGMDLDPDLICPPLLIAVEPGSEPAYESFTYKHVLFYLCRQSEPVTAIFCLNDGYAFAAIVACHEIGLRIPGDIEIAAFFDGGGVYEDSMPPMVKVVQNQSEIGREAAELIAGRIEQTEPDGLRTISIQPDVVDELSEH